MNIAMMQPTFLPWLGYFQLIHKSDLFVFLDDFQFSVQSYHQRNKLFVFLAPFNFENLQAHITEFDESSSEPSLGQKRSNGIENVSSLLVWAEYLAGNGPSMRPKSQDFHENVTVRESCREASRNLLERLRSARAC